MYPEKQYYKALALYDECGSVTKTITQLGYPARRQTLYNWITRRNHLPPERSTFHGGNTPEHPRHHPLELKLNALHRCFELGENVQSVLDEIGYSTASIYQRRRKYIQEGRAALMKPSKERDPLKEGTGCKRGSLKAQRTGCDRFATNSVNNVTKSILNKIKHSTSLIGQFCH